MEIIIFGIIAVVIIVVIVGLFQAAKIDKFRLGLEKVLPEAKVYVSRDDSSFLAVDFSRDKLFIGLEKARGTLLAQEQPYRAEFSFSAIVKVEVLRDGTQVASTNRGSQVLGAAVGVVAFGGIGAVIGGLSGSSTSSSGFKRLLLRITMDDVSKPIHEVTFYETDRKKGGKRGEIFFDQAAQQIAEFGAYLEAAIRKSENSNIAENQTMVSSQEEDCNLADQIGKLWKLKEAGAITQEEFDAQKARLMNS